MAQTEENKEKYKVHRISTAEDYHLIFLRKCNEKFTIYSKKSIVVKGHQIKKDSSYCFNLVPVTDTLTDGTSLVPMNYADITYFGRFTGAEIGKLCTATNLVGLVIPMPNTTCDNKKKKKRK